MKDRILAALMLFTRLPWWRLKTVDKDCFTHAVDFWPLVGWLTGGALALSFYLFSQLFPISVALILAMGVRLLLTGALHEDGLADFCDGMGGGCGRERILTIMKDTHIGTYGVIGLIVYYLLYYMSLQNIYADVVCDIFIERPELLFPVILLSADVWGKATASLLVSQLPYARREEEAKTKVVYRKMSLSGHLLRILVALLPVILLLNVAGVGHFKGLMIVAFLLPLVVEQLLALWMKKRLGGYTGDCCGATFLICELTFLLTLTAASTL